MRSILLLLPFLLALGCNEPERMHTLADYQFDKLARDRFHGVKSGSDVAIHQFGAGWGSPKGRGLWTTTREAHATFHLVGRNHRLRLRLGTSPSLAAREQSVEILWNDVSLGDFPVVATATGDRLEVELPESATGAHRLTLRPRHTADPRPGTSRRDGVAVYRLSIVGSLNAREAERWEQLQQVSESSDDWALQSATSAAPTPNDLPDVLLLIMDTARADRYGCYGYPRDTTPHVDALAKDSVVLRQVFAEAPYTATSVHGLLTGQTWRDHGVIQRENSLSPAHVTWAEILRGAGYQTLAYLGNPNVAEATGATQGFDEWVETWKLAVEQTPELPADLFHARLDQPLDDKPAFVFVHTLPPHEPYTPGPTHDLWKPAGYDGPITGHTPDIQAFDRGERPAEGPDFERLQSLYDGHLRRGDAMIHGIVQRWKELNRSRDTIVVIVSDHGEGFGEHGRFGHNSTLFDEMLHVPVILHPATRFERVQGSESRLRSLTDVMPLVLASLGFQPATGTSWSQASLRIWNDPSVGRDEIFLRTAAGIFGRRTETTLAFFRAWGEQGLFDLSQDANAKNNLRWTDPARFQEEARRIRAYVEGTGWPEGDVMPISDEDRERLKALGYL